jgi:ABC-type nitrate/sulfonate/bicarbonate transport system ATPase subunit
VSLVRALARERKFVLLDEPFSQLDSLTRFELQDALGRGRARPSSSIPPVTRRASACSTSSSATRTSRGRRPWTYGLL